MPKITATVCTSARRQREQADSMTRRYVPRHSRFRAPGYIPTSLSRNQGKHRHRTENLRSLPRLMLTIAGSRREKSDYEGGFARKARRRRTRLSQ